MDKNKHSVLDGVVVDKNTFIFIGVENERANQNINHGIIWKYKNNLWNSVEIAEKLTSCVLTNKPEYRFVAIAESGREFIIGDDSVKQEVIAVGEHSPGSNGPLTSIRVCKNAGIYSVGTARQVYKKRAIDKWERIDGSCKSDSKKIRAATAFMDIDGYSENELYAIGWEGEIWLYNNCLWGRLDTPTNLTLYSICCAEDGVVYICGQNGLVLKGRYNNWEIIAEESTKEDLRGIRYHDGKIYTCSSNLIYVLEENQLEISQIGLTVTTGKLRSSNGFLMSVGLTDVLLFENSSWKKVV